jgi:hypothetical protein
MHRRTVDEIYAEVRDIPPEERLKLAAKILNDLTAEHTTGLKSDESDRITIWQDLLELSKHVEESGVNLPEDLAEQHDHYLYGTPKR